MGHEDKVSRIFDTISLPVVLIDRNYTVVATNAATISHLRRSERDVIGQSCFATMHDRTDPCWRSAGQSRHDRATCPVKEAFETGRRARAIHKHWIGNQAVIEEVVATPLVGSAGQVDYVVEEYKDITELLDLKQNVLTTCHSCKRIRDLAGSWLPIEQYIADHTGADFSHSTCPDCFQKLHPDEPYPE